ncbi:alpha-1,2-fucosyltransferase [Photobacterium kishitanii]|uniref:Alpha-1,2-fucosyltransferase n=1 Tax=Photobacterium kishitanii TaxID=318456 RepID=A0A2T3KA44_9GAMM|nr:alpha-1,2-fucosyltransferase [Photobacterium kishitanii]PSU87999.1 hypothetical protein C9J27_25825 [Photobacterium kishitanii]
MVVYSQGGVGNQFFQFVYFLYLKSKGKNVLFDMGRVDYDSQHKGVTITDFIEIDDFNIIHSNNSNLPLLIRDDLISKCFRKYLRLIKKRKIVKSYYDYDGQASLESINSSLDTYVGYFQFVDSFILMKEEIERLLALKNSSLIEKYKNKYNGKTGLHIRRGDFLNTGHHVVGIEYIKQAIARVSGDIVVFSDDISWCKDNIESDLRITFHEGSSALDDFVALSQCTNYILSGSTFSWCSAFIFSNKMTQVIIPSGHEAQFMSDTSNKKIGWNFTCL